VNLEAISRDFFKKADVRPKSGRRHDPFGFDELFFCVFSDDPNPFFSEPDDLRPGQDPDMVFIQFLKVLSMGNTAKKFHERSLLPLSNRESVRVFKSDLCALFPSRFSVSAREWKSGTYGFFDSFVFALDFTVMLSIWKELTMTTPFSTSKNFEVPVSTSKTQTPLLSFSLKNW
jgi:hypothetical protein